MLENSTLRNKSGTGELIEKDCRFSPATFLVCRERKMKFLNSVYPKAKSNAYQLPNVTTCILEAFECLDRLVCSSDCSKGESFSIKCEVVIKKMTRLSNKMVRGP